MNTTDTSKTKMTTLSISVRMLNELHRRADGRHPISYYINRAALMKLREAQALMPNVWLTNKQWRPVKKMQLRLERRVWEYLEMNCIPKSRFINDAIYENLRYIKDPEP